MVKNQELGDSASTTNKEHIRLKMQQQSPNLQEEVDPKNRTIEINTFITPYEHEYLKTITSILSKIDINGNKILAGTDIADLIRVCLTYTCTVYQSQIFVDSSIVQRLPDKESVKEFIAFRKKYMGIPIDAQLKDLKAMGFVKPKKQQQKT